MRRCGTRIGLKLARPSLVPDVVVGLDLSLTGASVCVIPTDWRGHFSRVSCAEFGYGPAKTKWEREVVEEQGEELWGFERMIGVVRGISAHIPVRAAVFAESVFLSRNPKVTMQLSKLRGAVESRIWDHCASMTRSVAPSTHHKALTGRGSAGRVVYGPRLCVKNQRRQVLLAMGAPAYWTENQMDACSVALCGLKFSSGKS